MLSLPQRSSLAKAHSWAETQRDWVEAQLEKLPRPRPIISSSMVPYRGRDISIDWSPGHPRTPRLDEDRLIFGGPEEAIAGRVLRWLKAEARRVLEYETYRFALLAGAQVVRVSIGDARSRWGSCASGGNIRYSWRLVMAPPEVLSATVAHEVAHRIHMHHGPEFHAAVADIFGRDPAPERAWLRKHGAGLYWVGSFS
jgi:predicted metal-dependent hydrolase